MRVAVSWNDHQSFWRQGHPALMVTDIAFYRYAYYHAAQDTPRRSTVCAGVHDMTPPYAKGNISGPRRSIGRLQ